MTGRMTRRLRRPEGTGGFTLIELLVSISILGIILGALSSAMIVFLRNGAYTSARDDHSAGASLLASYLDRDLASGDTVTRTAFTAASCTGTTSILVVSWREHTASAASPSPSATGSQYVSTYVITSDADSGTGRCQLERRHTVDSGPVDRTVLVRNLRVSGLPTTTLSTSATSSCPAQTTTLTLSLPRYDSDDVAIDPYSYIGCVKARTR